MSLLVTPMFPFISLKNIFLIIQKLVLNVFILGKKLKYVKYFFNSKNYIIFVVYKSKILYPMRAHLIGEFMGCESKEVNPAPGIAVTYFIGSDRYPYVITSVISPKKICIARMADEDYNNNLITDEENDYQYLAMRDLLPYITNANDKVYTKRRNGRWVQEGAGQWSPGGISIGHADHYLDPCF